MGMVRSQPWIPASGQQLLDYLQLTGPYGGVGSRRGRRVSVFIMCVSGANNLAAVMDANVLQDDHTTQQVQVKGFSWTITSQQGDQFYWQQLIVLTPDQRMQWNDQVQVASFLGSTAGNGQIVVYTEEI